MAGRGPARRGSKNTALLAPRAEEPAVAGTVLVTGRPLRVGVNLLPIGVEVPGAEHYPRLQAWLDTRYIKRIPADEPHVSHQQYLDFLEQDLEMSFEDYARQLEVGKLEAEIASEGAEPEE